MYAVGRELVQQKFRMYENTCSSAAGGLCEEGAPRMALALVDNGECVQHWVRVWCHVSSKARLPIPVNLSAIVSGVCGPSVLHTVAHLDLYLENLMCQLRSRRSASIVQQSAGATGLQRL